MGEIADMMISGEMCEMCGVYLDGESYGVPRYCSVGCAKNRGFDSIASDDSGRYGENHTKPRKSTPKDVVSIKITYNGQKVFYVTQNDSTFENALDIAKYLNNFTKNLEMDKEFKHPKLIEEDNED